MKVNDERRGAVRRDRIMTTKQSSRKFSSLAVGSAAELIFGRAPQPVTCGHGLAVGAGEVYPEINFTLPTMLLEESTWPAVLEQYREIGEMIVRASQRLHLPRLMVEFELLPQMTEHPAWGAEITRLLSDFLSEAHERFGLRSALRVTPTDLRDLSRPPMLRSGEAWECMRASWASCAAAGAHVLSIESLGGKEVHDEAMMYGDLAGVIFALGCWRRATWLFSGRKSPRCVTAMASSRAATRRAALPTPRCSSPARACCRKSLRP